MLALVFDLSNEENLAKNVFLRANERYRWCWWMQWRCVFGDDKWWERCFRAAYSSQNCSFGPSCFSIVLYSNQNLRLNSFPSFCVFHERLNEERRLYFHFVEMSRIEWHYVGILVVHSRMLRITMFTHSYFRYEIKSCFCIQDKVKYMFFEISVMSLFRLFINIFGVRHQHVYKSFSVVRKRLLN